MSVVPNAPATVTAATVAARFNVSEGDAGAVLALAVETVNRELTGAFRDVPEVVYDDLIVRVVGAIVGNRKRPAGGSGQLTRTDQPAGASTAPAAPRDYVTPIRPTLALYVSPL